MSWVYIWLGCLVASLVIEFVTFELVSIWISVGSLVAMILAFCDVGYEIQIIVAVVISITCILSLRKITLKFLDKTKQQTNIDAAIGKIVKLISGNDFDENGTAKYNGVIWNVTTEDGSKIGEGDHAEILRIEGNKLVVKKVKIDEEKTENSDKPKTEKEGE